MKRTLLCSILVGFLCAVSFAQEATEKEKIEAALARMEKSDLSFIRNGAEHTGGEAAAHLRTKWKQASSDIKTFDDFVSKVATKSSLSGKPHLVKYKDGSTIELARWLRPANATTTREQ